MSRLYFLVFLTGACATNDFSTNGEEGETDNGIGSCVKGDVRCSLDEPGGFETCDEKGGWVRGGECAGGCESARCVGETCVANQIACTESGLFERCNPVTLGWEFPAACDSGKGCWDNSCRPFVCQPRTIVCDGKTASQCNDSGSGSDVIAVCPEMCTSGVGCQTFCDLAEDLHSSVGCLFYPFDSNLAESSLDDAKGYNIMVANTSATETANVELSVRASGGTWTPLTSSAVPAQGSLNWLAACSSSCDPAMLTLGPDRHVEGSGIFPDKAFKVSSDRPIVVYQLNSDDYVGAAFSPAASIVLPVSAIEKSYLALSWPHCANTQSDSAFLTVIASENNTGVAVRLSATANTVAGTGVPALAAGESFSTTLDEGEMLQLSTAAGGDDITGTYIEATAPITVYSGSEDACPEGGAFTSDGILEAMLPLVAWGKNFVGAAAPWTPSLYTTQWRILASEEDTTIEFENPGSLPGVPAAAITLGATEFTQFTVQGNGSNPGEFFISANKPIQPAQVLAGETAMVLSVPVEQFLPKYVFLTTPGYRNEQLTITRMAGAAVTVDGAGPAMPWYPGSADGWEVSQITMATDATHIVEAVTSGKDGGVGITVSGNGGACSFSYIGGLSQERINIIADTVGPSLK